MQFAKRLLAGAIVTVVCALGAGTALALPINGDQTVGIITSFDLLASQGISVGVTGSGAQLFEDSFLGDVALFQVSGGAVNPGSLTLEHQGQSLTLSNGVDIEFANLVIELALGSGDTLFGLMKADVTIDAASLGQQTIFDMTLCQNARAGGGAACVDGDGSELINGFRLTLSDFWTGTGVPVIEFPDDQFGVALLDVRVVPEPSTLTLASLGLLGLTLVGRRRR